MRDTSQTKGEFALSSINMKIRANLNSSGHAREWPKVHETRRKVHKCLRENESEFELPSVSKFEQIGALRDRTRVTRSAGDSP